MNRDELLGTFDLTGRTAIITGGSRGIGLAIAHGFAAMGADEPIQLEGLTASLCAPSHPMVLVAGPEVLVELYESETLCCAWRVLK